MSGYNDKWMEKHIYSAVMSRSHIHAGQEFEHSCTCGYLGTSGYKAIDRHNAECKVFLNINDLGEHSWIRWRELKSKHVSLNPESEYKRFHSINPLWNFLCKMAAISCRRTSVIQDELEYNRNKTNHNEGMCILHCIALLYCCWVDDQGPLLLTNMYYY